MVINPISVQGEITRAQDFTTIKHNQDNKAMTEQLVITRQQEEQTETKVSQVRKKDDPENDGRRFDAKEKGDGQYGGDGGRQRKKQNKTDGVVLIKEQKSFDIKI